MPVFVVVVVDDEFWFATLYLFEIIMRGPELYITITG